MGPSDWNVIVMNSRRFGWDDWPYVAFVVLGMAAVIYLARRAVRRSRSQTRAAPLDTDLDRVAADLTTGDTSEGFRDRVLNEIRPVARRSH